MTLDGTYSGLIQPWWKCLPAGPLSAAGHPTRFRLVWDFDSILRYVPTSFWHAAVCWWRCRVLRVSIWAKRRSVQDTTCAQTSIWMKCVRTVEPFRSQPTEKTGREEGMLFAGDRFLFNQNVWYRGSKRARNMLLSTLEHAGTHFPRSQASDHSHGPTLGGTTGIGAASDQQRDSADPPLSNRLVLALAFSTTMTFATRRSNYCPTSRLSSLFQVGRMDTIPVRDLSSMDDLSGIVYALVCIGSLDLFPWNLMLLVVFAAIYRTCI